MLQAYLLSPKERIKHWREFRQSFNTEQSDTEQLLLVENYWHSQPVVDHFILDVDDTSSWPTPWELIYDGNYCSASLVYLMEQTLLMSDNRWSADRLQLILVDDKKLSDIFMLLVADNKYVLNYSRNEIVDFDIVIQTCVIQHKYRAIAHNKHKII